MNMMSRICNLFKKNFQFKSFVMIVKCSPIFLFFFRNVVQVKKMLSILENLRKTFFYWKKIRLQVENRGYFWKKKFFKSFETSVIISLKKDNLPYLAVFRKKNSIGKYSNFKFQNRGYFEKMSQNPYGQQALFYMKKKFSNLSETSLIISLKKDNLPILAVLQKKNSTGKYSNFKFQKVGILVQIPYG